MRPIERARRVYDTERCARSFDCDVGLHLSNGYVHSDDDLFLLARPVTKGAPTLLVVDPTVVFGCPDCWLVYLAAGDLSRCVDYIPRFLPWVAWEIDNKLRYHKFNRAITLCLRRATLLRGRSDAIRGEDLPNLPSRQSPHHQRKQLITVPLLCGEVAREVPLTTIPLSWD